MKKNMKIDQKNMKIEQFQLFNLKSASYTYNTEHCSVGPTNLKRLHIGIGSTARLKISGAVEDF